MTAPAEAPSRVRTPSPLDVVRLQLAKRGAVFAVPLFIIAAVFVVSAVIAFAIFRLGGGGVDVREVANGARQNQGMVWALAGFMVALGVQAVATAFPFALALGATRRTFAVGTLLSHVVIAAYVAVLLAALLSLELLTGHWWLGVHSVDVYLLGAGDLRILLPAAFLGALTMLSVGSLFGAAWTRFGARGAAALGLALGLVLALALLAIAPVLPEVTAVFQAWWLAVLAVGIVLASAAASVALLGGSSVR